MERAVEFEIKRQEQALENGEKLQQETRGWDEATQKTFSQRIKETAADYRYFPEPDIPPLEISDELVTSIRATLPELPQAAYERLIGQYQFAPEDARALTTDKYLVSYAEQVISEFIGWLSSLPDVAGTSEEILSQNVKKVSRLVSNWLINRLAKHLNDDGISIGKCPITAENFAEFLTLIYQNKINNLTAQKILDTMYKTGENPLAILENEGLGQIDDNDQLETIIDTIKVY
jgi:aspartyl-tRNA(Asn)/glutamyl-tRNA(Gln) amidotransferase subunit B